MDIFLSFGEKPAFERKIPKAQLLTRNILVARIVDDDSYTTLMATDAPTAASSQPDCQQEFGLLRCCIEIGPNHQHTGQALFTNDVDWRFAFKGPVTRFHPGVS